MKKTFISVAMLIGMIASAMAFSSFTEPKKNVEIQTVLNSAQDGWREVGRYEGLCFQNGKFKNFIIWEKQGLCGAYYWTERTNPPKNPDQVLSGQLRKNSDGKWYAAVNGDIYIIRRF